MQMVEITHITIGKWSQIDKDNVEFHTQNPNKENIIIQSQSFIDFHENKKET